MKDFFKVVLIFVVLYALWRFYKTYIAMEVSSHGVDFIIGLEGKKNKAYKDSKGLWTTGVGHLIKDDEQYLITKTLSDSEVSDLFKKDLKRFVVAANDAINVPLSQHEFDAIISVLFNIGSGWGDGIGTEASFISDINFHRGENKTLHDIMAFRKPIELLPRRAKEARLYDKGNYDWKTISQQEVDYYANI